MAGDADLVREVVLDVLEAQAPLVPALAQLASARPTLHARIAPLLRQVEAGTPVVEALARAGDVLPSQLAGMLSPDASPAAVARAVSAWRGLREVRRRHGQSLASKVAYPAVVLLFAAGALSVVFGRTILVDPTVTDGAPTYFGNVLPDHLLVIITLALLTALLLFAAAAWLWRLGGSRERELEAADLAGELAALLAAGVDVIEALGLLAAHPGVVRLRDRLAAGAPPEVAIAASPPLAALAPAFVEAGAGARLDEALRFRERQLRASVEASRTRRARLLQAGGFAVTAALLGIALVDIYSGIARFGIDVVRGMVP